jgi:hypothetical protein
MPCSTCDFVWSDHSPYNFVNWKVSYPNNAEGVENCVLMDGFDMYEWEDRQCTEKYSYVCAYYVEGDPTPDPKPPSTAWIYKYILRILLHYFLVFI